MFWLMPIAYLVSVEWVDGVSGVIFAYMPLVALVWFFKRY